MKKDELLQGITGIGIAMLFVIAAMLIRTAVFMPQVF